MDGHEAEMNVTRAMEALSPYLKYPRQIVIRNEAFVAVAAAMLFLQIILGPWRRRSGHWFVQGTLWVAYTVSFPLITYTLGQMVTSPVKNMLYPVWALILFWAAGCANAFMAYNIEDNKQWKRYLFELLQYFVYAAVILRLFNAGLPFAERMVSTQPIVFTLSLLMGMVSWANLYRVFAGWMVTDSTSSKLVADYMRAQVQANTRSRAAQEETFTMSGCKYLVRHPFMELDNPRDEHRAITIEAVWGMPFDGDSLLEKQLRDVCLSFALSHLLRRRYFQMDCAEAGLPKTLQFALDGLLPEEDQVNHYSGAFHAVEVELGFLYDSLFTKYATLFLLEGPFLMMVIFKLIFASFCGVALIAYPPTVKTLDPIIEVGTRRVDVTVTVVIVGALLLFELLEAILYLTSDWATVSLACSYVRGDRCKPIASIIWFLRRFKLDSFLSRRICLFGYWQNKMGQSSVIGDNLFVHWLYVGRKRANLLSSALHQACNLICSMLFSVKNFVAVPDLVKSEIISCLRKYRTNGGPLTNGTAALERHGVLEDFSSTLKNDSQITVMLIWHIATEYCNMASSNGAEATEKCNIASSDGTEATENCNIASSDGAEATENCNTASSNGAEATENCKISSDGAEEGLPSDEQQVATTLSKYCAYLMYFVPELLAENSTDTLFIIHGVLDEVRSALGGDIPTRHRLRRIIQDSKSIRGKQDQTVVHDSDGPDNHATVIHIPPISSSTDNIISDSGGSSSTDNIISNSSGGSSSTDNIISNSSGGSNMDNIIHNSSGSSNRGHTTIAQDSATNINEDILIEGLKLGMKLEEKGVSWKMMAEFWAETIVYIAPSDKAAEHMERLAQGGEFLTHVWALLTHAGIVKRDQVMPKLDKTPIPDAPV